MEKFFSNLKSIVSMDVLIYIGIGIVAIIIITMIMMMLRSKKAKKTFEDLELRYNSLKSVPLAFKVNKAVALSRVNANVAQRVENCKNSFDQVQEQLKECSVLLAEVDDLVYVRKVKTANSKMEELSELMDQCLENVEHVSSQLDEVLEQESEQREQINTLKENFRALKKKISENRSEYHQSSEYLDREITSIEKMFSLFEEWMFASEFDKASIQQDEISKSIKYIESLINELPTLYEKAKGVLPRAIDEVSYNYAQINNKGVYLDHLETKKNLEIVSDMLKDDLNKLRNGSFDHVKENLQQSEKRLVQLQEQLVKEEKAFDEVKVNAPTLFEAIKSINKEVTEIEVLYNKVYERFGFENWNDKLKDTATQLTSLNELKRKLELILAQDSVPYTTILISYTELLHTSNTFCEEVNAMKSKLMNACSDEERAKKQLVKLQLIVNEISVKISKKRLPSINEKFDEDLIIAKEKIKTIETILAGSPLNVAKLNEELRISIDYIYTLYNNVNNLIGMAVMVENAIVFGNRYRSTYPELDSELTRAELCFRNGQYTKALRTAIQVIEKMHPGAYEKLIGQDGKKIIEKAKQA
ncbi:MAG: septation ring formation regulator EzrA [Erysipelotrichaceae bacterium]